MVDSIFQSGLQGVQAGLDQFNTSAHAIATAVGGSVYDLTTNLVDLKLAQRQIESSAAVIKVADEVLGTLLDEFA